MFHRGDIVRMNDNYPVLAKNKDRTYKVVCTGRVCGIDCVWLEDFYCAYVADGLDKVEDYRKGASE